MTPLATTAQSEMLQTRSPLMTEETDLEVLLPRLRRFARCLFCEPGVADEAVCASLEAMIAKQMRSGGNVVSTETWLFQFLIGIGRRHSLNGGGPSKSGAKSGLKSGTTTNGTKMEGDCPRGLDQAVSELGFEERAVIALHILEGLGLDETAELMIVPEPVVREHLKTAKTRIVCHLSTMAL